MAGRDGTTMIERRNAVRAILLTPRREVLLLRIRPPDSTDSFWITPGGGQELDETAADCLRRELREELGLEQFTLGPLVWRREHTFTWGERRIHQREQYHLIEVPKFTPRMSDPVESRTVDSLRWWTLRELSETRERLTPALLERIVSAYVRDGAPREPVALELSIE